MNMTPAANTNQPFIKYFPLAVWEQYSSKNNEVNNIDMFLHISISDQVLISFPFNATGVQNEPNIVRIYTAMHTQKDKYRGSLNTFGQLTSLRVQS